MASVSKEECSHFLNSYALQQSINKLVLWYKQRGLNFSVAKAEAVILTTKRNIPLTSNLNLNNTLILFEITVKFLDILFDTRQLSFNNRVKNEALRFCYGAFKTNPTLNLHVDTTVLPPEHHRNYVTLFHYVKLQHDIDNINYDRTFHSRHKSTETSGSRCRTLLDKYKIELPSDANSGYNNRSLSELIRPKIRQ